MFLPKNDYSLARFRLLIKSRIAVQTVSCWTKFNEIRLITPNFDFTLINNCSATLNNLKACQYKKQKLLLTFSIESPLSIFTSVRLVSLKSRDIRSFDFLGFFHSFENIKTRKVPIILIRLWGVYIKYKKYA